MAYHIVITARAEMEIEQAHDWWAANRSRLQADRWYRAIKSAILDLTDNPRIHAVARESHLFPFEIRNMPFGLASRPTHRIVFAIHEDQVRILTIRHVAQPDLRKRDLP